MDAKQNMDQAFIKKVTDIIDANLENEQFGVKELYRELGISQSNLLRKLKSIKSKSATQFIREHRLQKAMEMLQNNVATSSEIAYRVGFGSPSYFNKCFHSYYGYPPGETRIRNIKTSDQENITSKTIRIDQSRKKNSSKRRVLYSLLGTVSIIAIFYFIYPYSKGYWTTNNQETIIKDRSIAVLPCVNLSSDKENQYFADGQMEAILNHLAKIEELRVISRTTMLKYRETEKSMPEIGKELGVAYVLELSAQKSEQKVNITAQLIDAETDRYIWSDNYIRDLTDIFAIQTEIAQSITSALKTSMSPSVLEQIEKKPTENLEAYNLYLNGRFFWHKRTEEDLKRSVLYFEQALILDSTYAKAYAGLADSYFIMEWWGWYPKNEGYMKGTELASKALSLDSSISEAHATLGGIAMWYEWNWEKAERELLKAISLNPSYATAHQYYAELLNILQRKNEAREQIDLAIKLNPNAQIMLGISTNIYYNNNEFEKAIEERKKQMEFINEKSNLLIFKSYVHLGMDIKAIEHLKIIVSNSPNNNHGLIEKIYQESGINGVIYFCIDQLKLRNNYGVFTLYALVGDSKKVISNIEKHPRFLWDIKINPDFNVIKSDPVFMAELKNIKFEDNDNKFKKAALQYFEEILLEKD